MAFPAHIEPAIRKGIGLDIAADEAAGYIVLLQHDSLAIVTSAARRHSAVHVCTGHLAAPTGCQVDRSVQIIGTGIAISPIRNLPRPSNAGRVTFQLCRIRTLAFLLLFSLKAPISFTDT
jgi:hypothetical protein